jgi:hypothetical protein
MQIAERLSLHNQSRPKYTFSELPPDTQIRNQNPRGIATSIDNRKTVIKWERTANGQVPDILKREEFFSILGRTLCLPVIEIWRIKLQIKCDQAETDDLIQTEAIAMPFADSRDLGSIDSSQRGYILKSQTPTSLANLLVFSHWIGDDDRGIQDVVLFDNIVTYIDLGMCGPPHPSMNSPLRSTHPGHLAYNKTAIWQKCNPHKQSLVSQILSYCPQTFDVNSPPAINKIELLANDDIHTIAKFSEIEPYIADELILRKKTLHDEYLEWLKNKP